MSEPCKVENTFDGMVKKVEITLNLDQELDNIIYYLICARDYHIKADTNFKDTMNLSMCLNRSESASEQLKLFNKKLDSELYSDTNLDGIIDTLKGKK